MWQHRVNNFDWNDDWVFYDSRFNILYAEDDIFPRFLCEMLHPVVHSIETNLKGQSTIIIESEFSRYRTQIKNFIKMLQVTISIRMFEFRK